MDRLLPKRSATAHLGVLVAAAALGCDATETSRGVGWAGQAGRGAAAGTSAWGTDGAQGGAPVGGSDGGGVSGNAQAGSTTGGITTTSGGTTTSGTAISVGGAVQSGGTGSGGTETGGTGARVCVASMGEYCTCMPKFTVVQTVDGVGDEFAGLAPMTFALSAAPYVNPSRSSSLSERVTLRAGWSDAALHVHIYVEDATIVPDSSATLWNGDNVQLFVAPTDNLTGAYTGTEDGGAIHVLIAAPDAANSSRSTVIYQNGVSTNSPFVTGLLAGRRVTGGYEIEAQLQWLPVANPRRSGAGIGFDLLVGAAASASQGLALEGGLANYPVSAPSPACDLGGRIQPGCDDRTWCRPVLE